MRSDFCVSTASACCRWPTRTASRAAGRASTCAARISIATGTSPPIPSWRRRTRRSSGGSKGRSPPADSRISRWSCTTTATAGCTSAGRRCRSSIVISRAWRSSRSCCAADVVHRRVDQCRVPQQRHARRRLARALRHRRGRPRVQLQLDRGAEGVHVEPALEGLRREPRRGLSRLLRARETLRSWGQTQVRPASDPRRSCV